MDQPVVPQADGLTSDEAALRLRRDGPNTLSRAGGRGPLRILAGQFASPLVIILVGASAVSFAVGDRVEAGIIITIVALSALLGFVQEARSEAAVSALQARLALTAQVVRDGQPAEIAVDRIVAGDVVLLDAGDIVPADGRLVEANHLYVDESSLTGESAAALKAPATTAPAHAAPASAPASAPSASSAAGTAAPASAPAGTAAPGSDSDRAGLVYFGTNVVSGTGRVVITATGARTSYGAIARHLVERAPETDFQRGVRVFGLLIARVTLTLVVAVFAINVALQRPLFDALLFAIALAVGLTPELLPAIVTLNLTRGARALAAHGVLVKRLPAIQNLGGITILCTDKTGTLTEGKLALVRAVGIDRDDAGEASNALALAFLNSHFQASFTNPLDAAVLAGTSAPPDLADWTKLGELPYDFQRRMLTVMLRHGRADRTLVITKGAPETVVLRATTVREDHAARPIGPAEHDRLRQLIDGASADGYRLIAVASRELEATESSPAGLADADRLERDLVFEGVILFSDPPKAGVADTIAGLARQQVALKVLTGDNELVARHVADQVGLAVEGTLTGDEMRTLSHPALVARAARTTIFARVDPDQKLAIIRALRESGAVVGYLGDGINDAPSLHQADVGISVSNATDVARSAADIILLEPSLAAIGQGVTEGRRTFANTLKYIRMGTSSNFGNMLSMAGAALLLPFLPMTPGQILLNNLIYDASQAAIPTDTVDADVEAEPARWDVHAIERFMLTFGPVSSVFDLVTFVILLALLGVDESSFHTGWFVESLFSQILVVLVIRTRRSPFWLSRPSRPLAVAIVGALAAAVLIPLSPLGPVLGFSPLPLVFWPVLAAVVGAYLALVELLKRRFDRRPS